MLLQSILPLIYVLLIGTISFVFLSFLLMLLKVSKKISFSRKFSKVINTSFFISALLSIGYSLSLLLVTQTAPILSLGGVGNNLFTATFIGTGLAAIVLMIVLVLEFSDKYSSKGNSVIINPNALIQVTVTQAKVTFVLSFVVFGGLITFINMYEKTFLMVMPIIGVIGLFYLALGVFFKVVNRNKNQSIEG
ncbi:MAG: hypothetical protein COB67_00595 [SAR324 cluster bacterium]|uniref:Uncharacterized protein n=1 Tax=SAR324 cluster bacterium TaxID=2024889 RepID=A0A2A4TCY1_9DELT|nr:MAG: hypothetical protein COB67_00595 [SAR324 cluster bacterium]